MIKTTITGNISRDVETRYSNDGKAVITFNVAVNSREKNSDGDWEDNTYWFRIVKMPRTDSEAAYLQERGVKGARVIASGTLRASTYEAKDGSTRMSFDLAFPDVLEIFNKNSGENTNGETREERTPVAAAKSNGKPAAKKAAVQESDPELDDLPF